MSSEPLVILSLETSTATGNVALVAGEQVLLNESVTAERTHNAKLFGPVQRALAIAPPDLIVVGTGPGSYTGVRVSLAAAIGLSLVRQVPVIGLSSLLAADFDEVEVSTYQIVGDARRGQFFTATVSDGRFLCEPQLKTWEALCAAWNDNLMPNSLRVTFDEKYPPGAELQIRQPSAKKLAQHAQRLSSAERSALSKKVPEPYYLSAPFITEAKKGAWSGS